MKEIELLSPAKNAETGMAAIDCGADAVYIGASKFGARAAAGNNPKEIEKLADYAHLFYARVYVTVNTLIYDGELEEAERLVNQIYQAGADAIIIQDMALLEMDLPPVPIFASTQSNNYSLEKIRFLEKAGIKRAILARELSLTQIREIKNNTTIELEAFVHGALCVSLSGQCYLSEAICGRSANRGECSQPCRSSYDLIDSSGKVIVKDKHLLSLKDLNLSEYISDLIDAGITSFKIEGRLKDIDYVKNITAYYRQKIDRILSDRNDLVKSSSGVINIPFQPDPDKTFNRGTTTYFITHPAEKLTTFNSSKSIGQYIGTVIGMHEKYFELGGDNATANGDGICFTDTEGKFTGTYINISENKKIFPADISGIVPGTKIFRNLDKQFRDEILKSKASRKIEIDFLLQETEIGVSLTAQDSDGNSLTNYICIEKIPARNEESVLNTIKKQLNKTGNSIFAVNNITIDMKHSYFFPIGTINEIRRNTLSLLEQERINNFPRNIRQTEKNSFPFPFKKLDYSFNITNNKAREFYYRHGAEEIKPGFELEDDRAGKTVMKTKYCIKRELNICPLVNKTQQELNHPLYLTNNNKKYKLQFDCKECFMKVIF